MQVFVDNPLLTIFFCLGVGVAFGMLRFGAVSFGPAGALFAALALSAIESDVRLPAIVTSLSLSVFCYTVGLTAGPSFVAAIRSSWQPLVVAGCVVLLMAAGGLLVGIGIFGLDIGYVAGAFSGAGTATPALGAVQEQLAAGAEPPPEPAVGYAVAYPFAVLLTIVAAVRLIRIGETSPLPEDTERQPSLVVKTLRVTSTDEITVADMHSRFGTVVSRITRDGHTVVARDDQPVLVGDLVTITIADDRLDDIVAKVGPLSSTEPWLERSEIDFRRVTLSKRELVGRTVAELDLAGRFDATVSRVRRGDVDLIAVPDLRLQMGDRLRVTADRKQLPEVTTFLGDSARGVGDINALGLGLGMTIGLLFGLLSLPLPGGTMVLGSATGPLIVGVVLGALGRTGPIVWQLPSPVNNTLNQFTLLVFLVAVGSGAGADLVDALSSSLGVQLLVVALVFCLIHAIGLSLGMRLVLRYGTARSLGGLTGSQLNPAPFAYALSRVPDQRISVLYAMIFPVIMILKVLLAQLMVIYFG